MRLVWRAATGPASAAQRRGRCWSRPADPIDRLRAVDCKAHYQQQAERIHPADGTMVAGDGSGGFRLPNGAHVAPDWAGGTGRVSRGFVYPVPCLGDHKCIPANSDRPDRVKLSPSRSQTNVGS